MKEERLFTQREWEQKRQQLDEIEKNELNQKLFHSEEFINSQNNVHEPVEEQLDKAELKRQKRALKKALRQEKREERKGKRHYKGE